MATALRIATLALAACLIAPLAIADTHVLNKSGVWEAFGGTTKNGTPVCGISSSPENGYLGLKNFHGDATFTIQIGKKTWRIVNGSKQKLTMRFDQHSAWNANGTGMHFNDGDAGLEYRINKSELRKFMREFAASRQLRIHFVGSNTADWAVDLNGANKAITEFEACNSKLK